MPFVVVCLLVTLLTGALLLLAGQIAPRARLVKTNYRGHPIPVVGAALWLAAVAGYGGMAVSRPCSSVPWSAYLSVAFFTGLAGVIDDRFGCHEVGGCRGHLGELLKGHITSGMVKSVIMPTSYFATSLLLLHQPLGTALVTSGVICLIANSFNMLDMRPARAVGAWIGCVALAAIAARIAGLNCRPLLLLLGPGLLYFPVDLAEAAMLGDSGANLIGAVLGLFVALVTPVWVLGVLVGLLIYAQVYGEMHRA